MDKLLAEALAANQPLLNDYPFSAVVLFHWREQLRVQQLIYSLKHKAPGAFFDPFVELLADKYHLHFGESKNTVVVPSPSRNGERDHAVHLAQKLSQALNGQFVDALVREDKRESQKRKNRQGRLRLKMRKRKNESLPESSRIVFVDDLVTTGATVQAAFQALKKPIDFKVLALAERSSLLY